MKQIQELHFYVTSEGLLCEVLLAPESTSGSEINIWKHKLFHKDTAIFGAMKELYLAYNWTNGKKSETQNGKEENRQND